jgi:hypothetical protein
MSTRSWYETGFTGAEREAEKRELGGGPRRFWLRSGESREGVFIDDNPFCFWEHQYRVADSKEPENTTCIIKIHNECPACNSSTVQKGEYTGHLTFVDCTGYVSKKDGKEHKFELVEFCPKTKVMNRLKAKKEKKGSLIGQLYNVTRTDEHSPNTGDDIEFIREANLDGLYTVVTYKGRLIKDLIATANGSGPEAAKVRKYLAHHFQVPESGPIPERIPCFNYPVLHAPLEPSEMRKAISSAVGFMSKFGPSGGTSASAPNGSKADEDVPF